MKRVAALFALALLSGSAWAKDKPVQSPSIAWLATLEEGQKASERLGRPILLVTLWGPGT